MDLQLVAQNVLNVNMIKIIVVFVLTLIPIYPSVLFVLILILKNQDLLCVKVNNL